MARTRLRRVVTSAEHVHVGYVIEPNNDRCRATVISKDWMFRDGGRFVVVKWRHPDDLTVNAIMRGQVFDRVYRPADPITRWADPKETRNG